ncbi:MAG: photosystem reaction center subunit [Frankiales bacterium]|nr:photosystem reaction center subunit [Frankiales bacterium]
MIEVNLRELVGKTLLGRSGVRVGKVTEVYESTGGEGTFAAVKTGLFGNHSSFVPLAEAELHGDNVHVPYPKELIDQAPRVAADQELSTQEEERLFAHYGAAPASQRAAAAPVEDGVVTRSEERLHVATERVETGRARLRKYVVTETVTHTVPVSHEELRIVREPLEPGAMDVPVVTSLTEEVHEVVLSAERPVVQREIVPVERIRLDTESVSGEEMVTEQVRKEQVEVLSDLPVHESTGISAAAETTTHSELFVAPRGTEPSTGEATTSELFLAPREPDPPADAGETVTTEIFLAPREDDGASPPR